MNDNYEKNKNNVELIFNAKKDEANYSIFLKKKTGRKVRMIISEKQIMQLIAIAYAHMGNAINNDEHAHAREVNRLLASIISQQPEELKDIE